MNLLLRRSLLVALFGLPLLSLALNALGWLVHGLDLPFFDDWRAYFRGTIASLDPAYLFRPINDTMAPVGFALDALAQRYLNGNTVAYQLLSMLTVLGSLLYLQWRLLRLALPDLLVATICFSFTLLMLQPGSYWGRENIAYHQALPLVFVLLGLWLTLELRSQAWWSGLLNLGLGVLAGFTYISGAFAALAAGGTLLLLSWWVAAPAWKPVLRVNGFGMGLAGCLISVLQYSLAVAPEGSGAHRFNLPLARPYEADFWWFALGKVARALMLPADQPKLSFVITLLALLLVLYLAFHSLRSLRSHSDIDDSRMRIAIVLLCVGAVVSTYLVMVAAGRANLRPLGMEKPREIFSFAFQRFHFFWVTLIWPWCVAALWMRLRRSNGGSGSGKHMHVWPLVVGGGALFFSVHLVLNRGALDHYQAYRDSTAYRQTTVNCLLSQLQTGQGITCDEFMHILPELRDFTAAYVYGWKTQASFVRHFPILPLPMGLDDPAPWFRLSRDVGRARIEHIQVDPRLPGRWRTGAGARLYLNTLQQEGMARCVLLEVSVKLHTSQPDAVKLLYRPSGEPSFDERHAMRQSLVGSEQTQAVNFSIRSLQGFEDALRIDLGQGHQSLQLEQIEVRCRLQDARLGMR